MNALAQKAGIAALKDKSYVRKTLALIKKEKRFLEGGFKELGVKFFRSDANFYLLKINNASEVCGALGRRGILVRDCSDFKGLDSSYIRVAVKSRRDNERLLKQLSCVLRSPAVRMESTIEKGGEFLDSHKNKGIKEEGGIFSYEMR